MLWLAALAGCTSPPAEEARERAAAPDRKTEAPAPQQEIFVDRAAALGLDFRYYNGMTGKYYFPEIVGGGAALFDCDNDGDLDVYLVQGQEIGHPPSAAHRDRLYRNDAAPGANGALRPRFVDVTEAAGIAALGYGMGVAAGDYDNDGWVDLYVTNFGHNQMWRNNGDGTFTDVTGAAGTDDPRWSTSAAFVDFDRDGRLDLFVANYVDYRLAVHRQCTATSGRPDYCGPQNFSGEPDRLFRNKGDGTFEDVSGRSGIINAPGSGLGVVSADFNADGWPDIYVANDLMPNRLWLNRHDGTFEDTALLAGCALNMDGRAEASMGVDAGDFDNDGDEDLFMTHLDGETNTFYRNDGKGVFEDRTMRVHLAMPSLPFTGFGAAMLDYDNDGWLDILAVNGAVHVDEALVRDGDPYPFHQRNQLFHNRGDGTFADVSKQAGAAFRLSEVSRGAAVGDIDNDGDPDAVVVNSNGPVRLLINQVGQRRPWLGLRLVDARGGRDQVGARVEFTDAKHRRRRRRSRGDASYCSSNDPRVLLGLGDAAAISSLEVYWPSGRIEQWDKVPSGRYTTLVEGTGRVLAGGAKQ